MEQDLREIVKACVNAFPENGISTEYLNSFCNKYELPIEIFYEVFAKHLALEFAHGEISFANANCAINSLMNYAHHEVNSFVREVFLAFDSGEFTHSGDPKNTISWQKYTLPAIMKLLANENLLPHT